MQKTEVFQPATFSTAELQFLLEHLEESPTVALHGAIPAGVNPDAIRPALGRFAELEELRRVRGVPWAGYDPIRDSIERFIAFQEKCLQGQQLGERRHPSSFVWDSTGASVRSGIGSDASDMVRTELRDDGTRVPFGVQLVGTVRKSRMWAKKASAAAAVADVLEHDDHKGTITCSICDKVIASYDTDRGARVKNRAKKEAREHCLKSTKEQARHRSIMNVPIP